MPLRFRFYVISFYFFTVLSFICRRRCVATKATYVLLRRLQLRISHLYFSSRTTDFHAISGIHSFVTRIFQLRSHLGPFNFRDFTNSAEVHLQAMIFAVTMDFYALKCDQSFIQGVFTPRSSFRSSPSRGITIPENCHISRRWCFNCDLISKNCTSILKN
jgi:hypothetical protein